MRDTNVNDIYTGKTRISNMDNCYCYECGNKWESEDYLHYEDENTCPFCGIDLRNPVNYFYRAEERANIKDNVRDTYWLENVNLKDFLKEKLFRELKLKKLTIQTDPKQNNWIRDLIYTNKDLVKYCEDIYGSYNPSILDINFDNVARKIELIQPLDSYTRRQMTTYAISVGLKSFAQYKLDELYEAMNHREDNGIDIDLEINLIKSHYTERIKRYWSYAFKLPKHEAEKIQNEKIKEMNDEVDKLRFKIMNDLEKEDITNFTGMYTIIDPIFDIRKYVPSGYVFSTIFP